jgi:hypothetical protein
LTHRLPKELEDKLPTIEVLEEELGNVEVITEEE